jgi:hypothetical protein
MITLSRAKSTYFIVKGHVAWVRVMIYTYIEAKLKSSLYRPAVAQRLQEV